MKLLIGFVTVLLAAILVRQVAVSQNGVQQHVGPLPGGGFLLNSGWTLRPAGKQVSVDTLPMSSAVSNNGKYLLVLNAGYNPPSVSVIEIATQKEIGRTRLPDAWLGLAVAPNSDMVYVGGATSGLVYELRLDGQTGTLTKSRELAAITDVTKKGLSFIGDVVLSPAGRYIYAADLHQDSVAVIDVSSGKLVVRWKVGRRPYRLLIPSASKSLLVSSWAEGMVYKYDLGSGNEIDKTRVGPHPTDMLYVDRSAPVEGGESYPGRLFVAAANTNSVYSYGVTADFTLKQLESINVSMTPMHPNGMTPSALAVDSEGQRLYVACSDANAVAVADISSPRTLVLGFIPTGWYPTALRILKNGQLLTLNGKGVGSRANPDGPNPTVRATPLYEGAPSVAPGYVGHVQTGTASFIDPPDENQLRSYTRTVLENSPYKDELLSGMPQTSQESFFGQAEGHPSPIQHVIYIIKENRTYDQVLGDLEKGNGDKSLNLFSEKVTPNLHQLAREFVLYDNFYENADVSADGHNWAAAAIAPDYTVKLWPNSYARRRKTYDYEGGEPANTPPTGYIWSNALQAGITVRNYGEWVTNKPLPQVGSDGLQVAKVRDQALVPYTDMNYRSFDLDYTDVDRAKEFTREWKAFDEKGQAPHLLMMRLGNDHTSGTAPGRLTPLAFNADNDYAVGLLVDAVSHSKLWTSTAIFIIEDDAQNGPDHVDSHRAPAWVISPFTHRGLVDSSMYNQAGILRTIELLLGLRPMTHFDAAARSMVAGFSQQPEGRPFTAISPTTSVTERNPGHSAGSQESARMNFNDADMADDDQLNAVLWRSIKKTDPPAPVHSGFAP